LFNKLCYQAQVYWKPLQPVILVFKEVLLEMNELKQKIALFIDADNAPANKFEDVLSEVVKYGIVTIRKAYGNWKNPLAMIAASAHDNLCHILPCYH
jgi:hypothetical protein